MYSVKTSAKIEWKIIGILVVCWLETGTLLVKLVVVVH